MSAFGINFDQMFNDLGGYIAGGFSTAASELATDVGKPITEGFSVFGLKIDSAFGNITGSIGAGFEYVESAASFAANVSVDLIEFAIHIIKQLIKLLPDIRNLIKVAVKILKYGVETTKIMLLIAPLILIFYFSVYLIQVFQNKY